MRSLSRKRMSPGPGTLFLLSLLPGLFGPGCGGEEGPAGSPPPSEPNGVLSCADLRPGAPRTGGRFLCTACSQHWGWQLGEPMAAMYVLLELDCRSTTGARLTLLDPKGLPVWKTEVLPGDRRLVCVSHSPAPQGDYSLHLTGDVSGGLTSFSGSIWINVYNHRGEQLAPFEADLP